MNVFFAVKDGGNYFLDEKESHHCLHVLRKKENEKIYFINGYGELFEGKIKIINNKTIKIFNENLIKKCSSPLPYIHIAIAPTKQFQRMEWFLEKAVECGINEITFLKTERTIKINVSYDRCISIIRNAMKQSLMLWEPSLNINSNYESFLAMYKDLNDTFKGICKMAENGALFVGNISKFNRYVLIIGPEGDFTDGEIEKAKKNNFSLVFLSTNRLRTETAGLFTLIALRSRFF